MAKCGQKKTRQLTEWIVPAHVFDVCLLSSLRYLAESIVSSLFNLLGLLQALRTVCGGEVVSSTRCALMKCEVV